jgi:glycosyltransferase involved in cell wall biosynthesis
VSTEISAAGYSANGVGITFIICTFNHIKLLRKLIESMLTQHPPACKYEVLIVDNNSSDGTAEYGRGLANSGLRFRYISESRQGLSWARNAGAKAALFEFLIYLDDDAWLPRDYFRIVCDVVLKEAPDILGAPIIPDFADPVPAWFPVQLETRKKKSVSGYYSDVTVSGGNFGIRRDTLGKIGGFNPKFGMNGRKVGMLEERLAIEAYRRTTPSSRQRVYYSVEAYVYHYTPARRMKVWFQLHRSYIANYQLMSFFLANGVRNESTLRAVCNKRLIASVRKTTILLRNLILRRPVDSDRPMLALHALTLRLADCLACYRRLFISLSFLKIRNFTTEVEARFPRVCVLTSSTMPQEGKPDAMIAENLFYTALQEVAEVEFLHLGGLAKDTVRRRLNATNLSSVDAIIASSDYLVRSVSMLKGDYPHLQLLYISEEVWIDQSPMGLIEDQPSIVEELVDVAQVLRHVKFCDVVMRRRFYGLTEKMLMKVFGGSRVRYQAEFSTPTDCAKRLCSEILRFAPLRIQ